MRGGEKNPVMCMCVCVSMCVCVCVLLTQSGVVKGEVPQVARVLRQGEQPPRVAVPHQAAPGSVFQNSVLDDLQQRKWVEINLRGNIKTNPTPSASNEASEISEVDVQETGHLNLHGRDRRIRKIDGIGSS